MDETKTCAACGTAREDTNGVAVCPHCDRPCSEYRCGLCSRVRYHAGIGPE